MTATGTHNLLIDRLLGPQCRAEAPFLRLPDGGGASYAWLRAGVAVTAAHLAGLGVRPGDRVLAQVRKRPEALTLYLATVAAGAVFVPINTAYAAAEVDYFLGDAEPALFVTDDASGAAAGLAAARSIPTIALAEATPDPAGAVAGEPLAAAPRAADDLAAILYTSGTTGRSKGAMLTHGNLVSNAETLTQLWQFGPEDRLVHALPIFHTHGLFVATNVTLAAGGSLLFLPGLDLDQIARVLPEATAIMGVPTFYTRMLGDPRFDRAALAHLRVVISGSAPLLAETQTAFAAQTGHTILERYGMTETNMIASNPYEGERRPGTVGHPLPGVALRIAKPDTAGIGGIEVKGPNVTPGYWRNPEKTAASFSQDGFFITGDLGQIGPGGYLSIVGRQKDLVISGGFNIYPKEIEAEIDAIRGVLESAVFGLPDRDMGEIVAAAIVPAPGAHPKAETILAALKDRLARFKQPRVITFLPELPRNAMGKVQKNELRAQALRAATKGP